MIISNKLDRVITTRKGEQFNCIEHDFHLEHGDEIKGFVVTRTKGESGGNSYMVQDEKEAQSMYRFMKDNLNASEFTTIIIMVNVVNDGKYDTKIIRHIDFIG